jgi:diguanylate cyclase (GGDEF)-like protein
LGETKRRWHLDKGTEKREELVKMINWVLVVASYVWMIIVLFFWRRSPSEIKPHLRLTFLVAVLMAVYMSVRIAFIGEDGSVPDVIAAIGVFAFFTHTAALFHAVFIYSRALLVFKNAADTDHLTGLLNRRGFESSCQKLGANGQEQCYAVVMLDLLNFKSINDTKGHAFGDRALRSMAHIMIEIARDKDILSRYGGDEFLLLLRDTGKEGAERVIKKLKESLRQRHGLIVNSGIAIYPDDGLDLDQLIEIADERMYIDKTQSSAVATSWRCARHDYEH